MDKFEYYANNIVLESANYEEIKQIAREFHVRYTSQNVVELLKNVNKEVNQGNFEKGKQLLAPMLKDLKEMNQKVQSLKTTFFDDVKSKMLIDVLSGYLALLPASFVYMGTNFHTILKMTKAPNFAEKMKVLDVDPKKTIIASAITGVLSAFILSASIKHRMHTKWKTYLGKKKTGNLTKNDLLFELQICIDTVYVLYEAIDEFKKKYMEIKSKNPKIKDPKEIVKMIGKEFNAEEIDIDPEPAYDY